MKTWHKIGLISLPFGLIGLLMLLIVILLFRLNRIDRINLSDDRFITLSLTGDIPENPSRDVISQMLLDERPTILGLLRNIQRAEADGSVQGIILRPRNLELGWAKLDELRNALIQFKKSGKQLVSYLETASTRDYFLATASDKIFMHPHGQLFLVGLASEMMFLKGTLEKVGVKAHFEHIGQFKTAADVYTRKNMSDSHRAMISQLLDDIYGHLLKTIETERDINAHDLRSLIDRGPFDAPSALEFNLADSALYWEELKESISLSNGDVSNVDYFDYSRERNLGYQFSFAPKIALIFAQGTIVSGHSGYNSYYGDLLGSDTLIRFIERAADDESIQAIVMRIDSPGGSAMASDAIWNAVRLAREQKPFVVSMSDVAASGGYYIAMAADTIVAQPGTITGSIGVLAGKFNLKGLYQKIGVNKQTLNRGRHADLYSDFRGFTAEERKHLRKNLKNFYDNFVSKAAEGRCKTFEEIDRAARGRVWSGEQALKAGLIDTLGGLNTSIRIAKKMAGLPEDAEVQIVISPRQKIWKESLIKQNIRIDWVPGQMLKPLSDPYMSHLPALFRNMQILALMPYQIEIK